MELILRARRHVVVGGAIQLSIYGRHHVTLVLGGEGSFRVFGDNEGFTPLHYAVTFSNLSAVEFLLSNRADPNAQSTNYKLTPLMLCTSMHMSNLSFSTGTVLTHYLATQNLLLLANSIETRMECELIANASFVEPPWTQSPLNKRNAVPNNNVWTCKQLDVIKLLGPVSDPHTKDVEDSSLLHHLVQLISEQNSIQEYPVLQMIAKNNEFAAHWSVPNKHNIVPVKALFEQLRSGFGGNLEHDLINTVLIMCKKHQIKLFHGTDFEIIRKIFSFPNELREGFLSLIDPTTLPTKVQVPGPARTDTLLHNLITSFNISAVKDALKLQPQAINVQDSIGQTLLFVAVQLLVQLESYYSQVDDLLELLEALLLQKGVDMNLANDAGDTPLHLAAQRFHLGAIDAMHGNMDQTFIFAVPFCLTAFKLYQYGASVDVKNKQGLTPLDYCPNLVQYYNEFNGLIIEKHSSVVSSQYTSMTTTEKSLWG